MTGGIEDFYVHQISVETFQGAGATGDVYAAPATVAGFLEGKLQLVRDSTGQQVVAGSTFYCSTTDGAKFTPDSRVTINSPGSIAPGPVPPGPTPPSNLTNHVSHVISQNVNDAPGLGLPEHAAIYLK